MLVFERSGHVLSNDVEKEDVAKQSLNGSSKEYGQVLSKFNI